MCKLFLQTLPIVVDIAFIAGIHLLLLRRTSMSIYLIRTLFDMLFEIGTQNTLQEILVSQNEW